MRAVSILMVLAVPLAVLGGCQNPNMYPGSPGNRALLETGRMLYLSGQPAIYPAAPLSPSVQCNTFPTVAGYTTHCQ